MSTERLVVIGADAAGMTAATNARRVRAADALAIDAFDRGGYSSYAACGIPYFVGGVVDELDDLVARTPDEFRVRQHIGVHLGHDVTEIDLARGAIRVEPGDGTPRWEPYDQLMVATGAVPIRPALEGIDAAGIFGVHELPDGVAIREWVRREQPTRAVVVGGGYVSLEMAEAFAMLGLETHLVEMASHPMTTLDPDMGELVANGLRDFGVELHLGKPVEGFDVTDGRVRGVRTPDGAVAGEVVALGLGVQPQVDLAAAAGIALGPSGAIAVDDHQRTAAERVWSAGDCCEKWHRISQQPVAVALGTHANKQGRVAGLNIAGRDVTFPGIVGTAATKVCALEVARPGLTTAEATAAGFRPVGVTAAASTRAGYYPGAAPITTKLVIDEPTGRVLGGQIVGLEGAAKRIDVLAVAIWHGMTVGEIVDLDLSYAPPYSPVWDPVLVAARAAVGTGG
jgi:NADPH-dependent 2,4-dienoyl-CoA reductase/sulfur reductase-like enzyme